MKTILHASCIALFVSVLPSMAQVGDTVKTNTPWDVTATAGLTLTRGNSKTLLVSGNIQAIKKYVRDELNLGVDGVYGENDSVKNSESVHAYGQYNALFSERFFAYGRVEGLHDAIADVDYRVSLSPGLGYYFIKSPTSNLRGEVGPGYVFERVGGENRDYAVLRVAERYDLKLNDRVKVWESVEVLPQIDDFANYVVNAEVGIETAMSKKFSQVTFIQDTYRSRPAPGRTENDLKLIAGIKYKF